MKIVLNESTGTRSQLIKNNADSLLIFFLYFFLHLFMKFNRWDDVLYTTYFETYNYNMFSFISRQYQYWTSRVFIEAAAILFGWLPRIIWVVVDSLMIVLLYRAGADLIKLITEKQEDTGYKQCQMFLFLCFPYALMATAGWLTTTINWTWMLALLVYGIKVLLYSVMGKNERQNIVKNVMYCIAYIYATNFDVAAIVMSGLLIVICVACMKSSGYRFCIEYWEAAAITVMNLLLFVICPGNWVRMEQDAIIHDTADVLTLSFWGKIRMGINSAFYHYMSIPNVVLFTVCAVLMTAIWLKASKKSTRIIAFIPMGITVGWTIYMFFAYTVKNRTLTYIYPDALFNTGTETEQYLALSSALILVASILYLLRAIIPEDRLFIPLAVILFIWGLVPDIVLGFTSTISASILRVVSFLYLAFIFLTCVVIKYSGMLKNCAARRGIIFLGMSGAAFNLIQIIRHIIVYG